MSDTIMVTGAAGFIGSHLSERLLKEGFRVVGLDNFCDFYDPSLKRRNIAEVAKSKDFLLVEGDIRDKGCVEETIKQYQPRIIIHIAAMAGVRPSILSPGLYASVNVEGTVNLLEAAVKGKVEKFIFASSSSVYGNNKKVPFSEDDPVDHPISPYAATKKACELLCYTFFHLYGIKTICLRLFTVFGPRQRPDLAIAKFMRLMAQGSEIPIYGDGSTSRDYTYIDDIVDGFIAAMQVEHGYRIYNLGGSHPVSLLELVDTLARVTGLVPKPKFLPAQPGDVERTFADLTLSRAELGFSPKVGLEEGIARQWDWFCSQPWFGK